MNGISLRERVLNNLRERRERVLNNQLNCIPSPFKRFSNDFIGIEQSCYYGISSCTRGEKYQLASHNFLYEPLMFCYYAKTDVYIKVIYFQLE